MGSDSALPDEPHLTPAELAAREKVSLRTVYDWNWKRTGPRYLVIGRHVRYPVSEVVAWEKSRYMDSENEAS